MGRVNRHMIIGMVEFVCLLFVIHWMPCDRLRFFPKLTHTGTVAGWLVRDNPWVR